MWFYHLTKRPMARFSQTLYYCSRLYSISFIVTMFDATRQISGSYGQVSQVKECYSARLFKRPYNGAFCSVTAYTAGNLSFMHH